MKTSNWLDRILSVSAIVAAVSAVVSVDRTRLIREQQKTAVWPYLTQMNTLVPGQPYTRKVTNVGVGPARVRSFAVTAGGVPMKRWSDVLQALIGETEPGLIYSSFGRGSVVLPGTTVEILRLPAGERAVRFWQAVNTGRFGARICCCSLYEDCRAAESVRRDPVAVDACTAEPALAFEQ